MRHQAVGKIPIQLGQITGARKSRGVDDSAM
jgi:hypothetical protein